MRMTSSVQQPPLQVQQRQCQRAPRQALLRCQSQQHPCRTERREQEEQPLLPQARQWLRLQLRRVHRRRLHRTNLAQCARWSERRAPPLSIGSAGAAQVPEEAAPQQQTFSHPQHSGCMAR